MMMVRFLISLSITLFACAAHGENFALIMNIGDYQARGVPKLYGVQHDREAARQIARKIGTKDENIFVYKDAELTLEGLRKAFADLNARLMPGDRVFMYYSGHGARVESGTQGACSEGLVSVKGELLLDKELEEVLKGMAQKADKVIFFLDACHSGGITTRAGTKPPRYMPKSATIGAPSSCRVVTNQLTRSVTRATQSPDSGGRNYVFISAARDSEVALDDPEAGGVATKAWSKCINGAAKDLDNSGAITADEIRTCAQNVIDQELKDVEGYVPHHIMIVGNPYLPLAFPDSTQVPATAPAAAASSKPAASTGVPTTSPVHTLRDIFHQRDDNRAVKFSASRDGFKIGKDKVQFTLNSTYPGYVYILMAGSDNKTLDLLFPNKADQNNYLQANENWTLPRPSWEIEAGGPAGTNHLLVIVADAPRDFSKIITDPAGPFASVDANTKSSKEVLQTSGASVNKLTSTCAKTRNLKVVEKGCSDGFGAAMIEVKEIN